MYMFDTPYHAITYVISMLSPCGHVISPEAMHGILTDNNVVMIYSFLECAISSLLSQFYESILTDEAFHTTCMIVLRCSDL